MTVDTTADVAGRPGRIAGVVLFAIGLLIVGTVYWSTFESIARKWADDAAYSHGFLILPISAWLVWRKRFELATLAMAPSAWGVLATAACAVVWMVARGSGVLVVEQLAAVALVPSLVLAAFGWHLVRALMFPLAFLFFAVPFGRALVPVLMQVTADFSTLLLRWSGVPVFRSHMLISIPAGNFEVARACSGLNYLITSLVLGVLYACLNFQGWRKRLACVAAFVVIPIVLNGLRVYVTILVSHWTDMRFGPGYEHVTFGRIFFVVIIVLLFWLGRRWHDADPPATRAVSGVPSPAAPWRAWWPLAAACLVALAGPALLQKSMARAGAALADTSALVLWPAMAESWQGPTVPEIGAWRPLYRGGIVEQQARFRAADGVDIDAFVAVYGLGRTQGAEMVSYSNMLTTADRKSLSAEVSLRAGAGDHEITVRELELLAGAETRLVWYWFVVGQRAVSGTFATKALEAAMVVTGGATSERIVVLSTPADDAARDRLARFVREHAACVTPGFQGTACES
jgi:exosortase A